MCKSTLLAFVLVLLQVGVNAQCRYNAAYLNQLSETELNVCFEKAYQLEKSGKTMMKYGGIAWVGGFVVIAAFHNSNSDELGTACAVVSGLGFATAFTGLLMKIEGTSRLNTINYFRRNNRVGLSFHPYSEISAQASHRHQGISVRFNF